MTEPKGIPLTKEMLDELYHTRIVVLIESGPDTNIYHQVAFSEDQFQLFTDMLASISTKLPNGWMQTRLVEPKVDLLLPPDTKDRYENLTS